MDWTLERLQQILDDKLPETDEREYKSKRALQRAMTPKETEELSKDVSAMANHPGGVLILGMEEEEDKVRREKLPSKLDGYGPTEISKSWIEDKLEHIVTPRLPTYRVDLVPTDTHGYIYVIEIPRSSSAPHQARDLRYYRRKGARSVPADHLEIEGIRHAGAPIELGVELYRGSTFENPLHQLDVSIVIRNEGLRPSKGLYVVVLTPKYIQELYFSSPIAPEDPKSVFIDSVYYRKFHMQFGASHNQEILYPGQATQKMPILSILQIQGAPLKDVNFFAHSLVLEVQTLEGYRKSERRDLKEMIDDLVK